MGETASETRDKRIADLIRMLQGRQQMLASMNNEFQKQSPHSHTALIAEIGGLKEEIVSLTNGNGTASEWREIQEALEAAQKRRSFLDKKLEKAQEDLCCLEKAVQVAEATQKSLEEKTSSKFLSHRITTNYWCWPNPFRSRQRGTFVSRWG